MFEYRYEVVSKKSFFDFVDIIYFEENLRVGHTFYVKVNKEQNTPRIMRVYREIKKKV